MKWIENVITVVLFVALTIGLVSLYEFEDSKLEEPTSELKFVGIYEGDIQILPEGKWGGMGVYLDVGNGKHSRYIGDSMEIVTGDYVFKDSDHITLILTGRFEE